MLPSKYTWDVLVEGLVKDKDLFPHILKNRSIADLHEFFHMGREALHDSFLLRDMAKAKARILQAVSARESILIYGDYDCDGITSLSVMMRAMKKLGANVDFDLPDRFQDGYGLNMRAVEDIIKRDIKLVITVDNGITCNDEVAALQARGIDTIITDHHEPKAELPAAFAIVHPKLSPEYPFKELAGVGVAYKLASAVLEEDLPELADLVMIGTIADMMPLIDENQAFVNLGIAQLKQTVNLGLKKIIQHSNLEQINETAIAFKIAPKINSSGRMNKAKDAVSLLVTTSDAEANRLILEIEQNHLQRKDLTDEAYLLCETLIRPDDSVLVVAHENLHEGIIGICAQKLVEKYQKTTCVIYIDEQGVGKGSMRAFGEDNALELLQANQDLLNRFGGHSQAAGLQLPEQNIDALRARMNKEPKAYIKPTMKIDMEIRLQDIELKTIVDLEAYSFFTAKFLLSHLVVKSKTKMSEKHTKLVVSDGLKLYDAVLFNNLEYYYLLGIGDVVDIVGGLSVNTWRNVSKLQILIKDLRCGHFQAVDFRHQAHYVEALQNVTKPAQTALINDVSMLKDGIGLNPNPGEILQTVWVVPLEAQVDLEKYATRAGLLEFYRLLQTVDLIPKPRLALKTKIHPALLDRVLDVFVELSLVKVRDDVVHYIPTHIRQDLEGAAAYAKIKQIAATIKTVYQLEAVELRPYFQSLLEAN